MLLLAKPAAGEHLHVRLHLAAAANVACCWVCRVPVCRQSGDVKLAVTIYVSGWITAAPDFETTWAGCVPEGGDAGGQGGGARR